jgi:hypothetical protein
MRMYPFRRVVRNMEDHGHLLHSGGVHRRMAFSIVSLAKYLILRSATRQLFLSTHILDFERKSCFSNPHPFLSAARRNYICFVLSNLLATNFPLETQYTCMEYRILLFHSSFDMGSTFSGDPFPGSRCPLQNTARYPCPQLSFQITTFDSIMAAVTRTLGGSFRSGTGPSPSSSFRSSPLHGRHDFLIYIHQPHPRVRQSNYKIPKYVCLIS